MRGYEGTYSKLKSKRSFLMFVIKPKLLPLKELKKKKDKNKLT